MLDGVSNPVKSPSRPGRLRRWFRDLRVSRKLLVAILVHLLHAGVLLAVTAYGMQALSASRAYVEGEGLWSKAEKEATLELLQYIEDGNETDYADFWAQINVTLGDHAARLELNKPNPDYGVVARGFVQGRIHPDDVDNLAWLYRTFGWEPHIASAIRVWTLADEKIVVLIGLAEQIHQARLPPEDTQRLQTLRLQVRATDDELTALEDEFSRTLGDGARWLTGVVVLGTLGLTVVFVGGALVVSLLVARHVTRSLTALRTGTQRVAGGELGFTIDAEAADEVGMAARAFNEMSQKLAAAAREGEHREKALAVAKERAENADEAKSRFLATMSHEMRTPLNAVIGVGDLLVHTPLSPDQAELVASVQASGMHLLSVVNDILDYSKLEAGRLVPESMPVDLPSIAEAAVDLVASQAAAKGLELVCRCDPSMPAAVRSDSHRIRQILVNLLSNAVKFTAQGQVVVQGRSEAKGNGLVEVRFVVEDSGAGIAPDVLPRLFQPFVQGDTSLTRHHEGTGLGLAISRSLARLLGGDIEPESVVGKGSRFTFRFVAPLLESLKPDPERLRDVRVLVMIPQPATRAAVTDFLRGWSATILDIAPGEPLPPCDVALVDGPEAERAVASSTVPVVALSSLRQPSSDIPRAISVTKPVHGHALAAALDKALQLDRPAAPAPQLAIAPLRILLAEDNPVNQTIARKMLERLGQKPVVVNDGIEALDEDARATYDLILLDVHMPRMDGLEAARQLRKRHATDGPRLCAVTADAMTGDRERCLEAGMHDYLPKPIRMAELAAVLRSTPHR